MKISIKPCLLNELDLLQKIGRQTFMETYGAMNNQKTMDMHLQTSFHKEKLSTELNNRSCKFYFLYADNNLAGYLKVNDAPAQSDINDPRSMEVERIYVRKAYKEKGIGKQAIDYVFELAIKMKKDYIWLGVWEKNVAAISFYTKMGFQKAGQHLFKMGDELQKDLIMKKSIQNNPE
jgi:ribosomal protein S18 acetylase RimI-like enzyme